MYVFQLLHICEHVWIPVKLFISQSQYKLDGNYTRMLRAILIKYWRQYPARHQLYDHQPPPHHENYPS